MLIGSYIHCQSQIDRFRGLQDDMYTVCDNSSFINGSYYEKQLVHSVVDFKFMSCSHLFIKTVCLYAMWVQGQPPCHRNMQSSETNYHKMK